MEWFGNKLLKIFNFLHFVTLFFKLFQKPFAGDRKAEIETLKSGPEFKPVSKSGSDFETMTKLRSDIEAETKRLGKFRSECVA
jgi:hypothetical protein